LNFSLQNGGSKFFIFDGQKWLIIQGRETLRGHTATTCLINPCLTNTTSAYYTYLSAIFKPTVNPTIAVIDLVNISKFFVEKQY
jgi:hypothetical protein